MSVPLKIYFRIQCSEGVAVLLGAAPIPHGPNDTPGVVKAARACSAPAVFTIQTAAGDWYLWPCEAGVA